MEESLFDKLIWQETDIHGVMERFYDDKELYVSCLQDFIQDETMNQLIETIEDGNWDDAFTAVHALKGLAANLGFIPLMHECAQLVVVIRTGRTEELEEDLKKVKKCYDKLIRILKQELDCDKRAM